jgi:hypothetical protein
MATTTKNSEKEVKVKNKMNDNYVPKLNTSIWYN